MNYASAIHLCRNARERATATAIDQEVSRANKYRPPSSLWEFKERLREALEKNSLTEAEIHEVELNGRVDVIRNGRTLMSWTPTMR